MGAYKGVDRSVPVDLTSNIDIWRSELKKSMNRLSLAYEWWRYGEPERSEIGRRWLVGEDLGEGPLVDEFNRIAGGM